MNLSRTLAVIVSLFESVMFFVVSIGTVGPFLMVSGFRKDAPTVAVVTASCTASPTSSIRTAVRKHKTYTCMCSAVG